MTGKTHFVCGEAAALLLLQPAEPKALLLTLAAAAVGSTLPDVDVTTSDSHADLARIVSIAGGAVLVTWAVNVIWNLQLERLLAQFAGHFQWIAWLVLFLALCVFGAAQPHRSFMHSAPGLILLTVCVCYGMQPLAAPFAVAMASHILLDLFNKKPVWLLYPLRWGLAFRLCSSNGAVNRGIFLGGTAALLLGLALALVRCGQWAGWLPG